MNKFLSTTTSTQQLALLSIGQPRFLSSNSKSFIRARRPLSSSIEKNNNNKSKGGGGSYYISHVRSNWNNLHSASSINTNGCRYGCGCGSGSGCTRDCINRSLHTSCVRFFYSSSPIQHNQQNSNNDNGNKCGHDNDSTSNNSNNNTDDILNKTTPLSDVSPSDLQLAMEATGTTGTATATDMENHHHHHQQQQQLLPMPNLNYC
mmetsp:Transcript_19480/g.29190  ORF Transcript_19480/g.29190 Transcript_19480/m.29190 type:complete len:205 (+) Transcript_19480:81-695(+)